MAAACSSRKPRGPRVRTRVTERRPAPVIILVSSWCDLMWPLVRPSCRARPSCLGFKHQQPDHVGDQEAPLDPLEPGGGGKRNAKAKMPNHGLITGTVWRGAINKEKAPRGAGLRGGSFGVTLRSLTSFAGLRCANIAIQARGFCMPRPRLARRPRPPPTGGLRAGAKTTFAKP